jgi:hypothetical protein
MSASLPAPLTRAEATNYLETSRHPDAMRFIAQLAGRGDRRLTVTNFGVSPEGRDMPLLILSAQGLRTPEEAQRAGLPIVLVINGIHHCAISPNTVTKASSGQSLWVASLISAVGSIAIYFPGSLRGLRSTATA